MLLKTRILGIGLIFGGLLGGLLLLEITIRLFLPAPDILFEYYGDTYVCSPSTGWAGRPNYQGLISREEYKHPVQFNAMGMYDTDHPQQKPDNVFRILWTGDSFAQTLQVDEAQTAHQQLEDLLNERLGTPDRIFEVISSGVIGWGTGQELMHYREQGQKFQPDLILNLFFMGNDVNDNLPGHALTIEGFNCFAPYFPICDDTLDPEPWYYIPGIDPAWQSCSVLTKGLTTSLGYLQRNSHLFAQLEPLLLNLKERRTYGKEFGLSFAALYLPEESTEVQYGWQVTEGLLSQFDKEAKTNGSDFTVAIVGPREVVWLSQLTEEQLQQFYQETPDFANSDINRPNQRLSTYLSRQNIPVLDLQQPMVESIAQTGAELYLPIDRHWTVAGNRVVAELIFEWLTKDNLLLSQDDE